MKLFHVFWKNINKKPQYGALKDSIIFGDSIKDIKNLLIYQRQIKPDGSELSIPSFNDYRIKEIGTGPFTKNRFIIETHFLDNSLSV